jgi:nitrite reductase (NADH) small subunit
VTAATVRWHPVCGYEQLLPERGAAALVDGVQIAICRTFDGVLYAVGNRDPFTGAFVLSRGIVGSRGDRATLTSPLHKQVYDLETGRCLDDPEVRLATYPTRVSAGVVEVALQ